MATCRSGTAELFKWLTQIICARVSRARNQLPLQPAGQAMRKLIQGLTWQSTDTAESATRLHCAEESSC